MYYWKISKKFITVFVRPKDELCVPHKTNLPDFFDSELSINLSSSIDDSSSWVILISDLSYNALFAVILFNLRLQESGIPIQKMRANKPLFSLFYRMA